VRWALRWADRGTAAPGPLTPTLSLRERGLKQIAVLRMSVIGSLSLRERGLKRIAVLRMSVIGSLSLRERAGVRGPVTTDLDALPHINRQT